MNLKQAKEKLASVSNSTGTKHTKVLVSELCVVIKFLLEEIDSIGSSNFVLPKVIREDSSKTPPWPRPNKTLPGLPGERYGNDRKRDGNAGDAE